MAATTYSCPNVSVMLVRRYRAIAAAPGIATVSAGSVRCLSKSTSAALPAALFIPREYICDEGKSERVNENSSSNKIPIQNEGSE